MMKKTVAALTVSLAVALGACAAPGEPGEELVASQEEALRIGNGDPDACTGALFACYQSCKRSGSASCFHYCDIVHAKCRGLPAPGGGDVILRAEVSPTTPLP